VTQKPTNDYYTNSNLSTWPNQQNKAQLLSPNSRLVEVAQIFTERAKKRIELMGEESCSAILLRALIRHNSIHKDPEEEFGSLEGCSTPEYELSSDDDPEAGTELQGSQPSALSQMNPSETFALKSFEDKSSTAITFLQLHFFLSSVKKFTPSMQVALRNFIEREVRMPLSHVDLIGTFLENWGDLNFAHDIYSTAYSQLEPHQTVEKYEIAGNISSILEKQERFVEMEAFSRDLVLHSTQENGKEHDLTMEWLIYLSISLWGQDKKEESRVLDWEIWETRKRTLGENHRETLSSARQCWKSVDDDGESEALCRQILSRRETHLGHNDAETLQSYTDLLELTIRKEGKENEAIEKSYWELLNRKRIHLGDENEDTRRTAWDLIGHLKYTRKYGDAEVVCLRLLKLDRKILGDLHKDTLMTVDSLKECLEKQGKLGRLENVNRSLFKAFRRSRCVGHHDTLKAASRLVDTLLKNGKDQEAESILRSMLDIDRAIVAEDSYWRMFFFFDLGVLLYRQEQWSEAEIIFRAMLNALNGDGQKDEDTWEEGKGGGQETMSKAADDHSQSKIDEDDVGEDCLRITIADVLQELEHVLLFQGKAEEANIIGCKLALEIAGGRGPELWKDID